MRLVFNIIIISLVSAYGILVALANEQQASKTQIVPSVVQKYEFFENYKAIGQLKLAESKNYFAQVAGNIDFITASENQMVQKGDLIIAIDRDIASKMLAQAEANLYMVEANYKRDLMLLNKKIISVEEVNKSKTLLEQARYDYAKLLKTYRDMVISADDDGYVGVVRAKINDEVKAGDYLFSFLKKSDFVAIIELPELLREKILLTDQVHITPRYSKEQINGQILSISDYLSNNGTISARVKFPYSEKLTHNSFAEVEITFNKHTALSVPEKSVLKDNEGNFVYQITSENKIKKQLIKPGVRTENFIELTSGELKEGDKIVLDGLTKVFDGAEVELIKPDAAAGQKKHNK